MLKGVSVKKECPRDSVLPSVASHLAASESSDESDTEVWLELLLDLSLS